MKRPALIAAGTIASAVLLAGCQRETKTPEPVRPVLSMILEPSRTDGAVAVGVSVALIPNEKSSVSVMM